MARIAKIWCALLVASMTIIAGCGESEEDEVGDIKPPRVENVIAAGGVSAAATNGPIMITFTEAMDPATVQSAVTFSPSVDGVTAYNAEARVLTFDPGSDLQSYTTYSVTVSGASDKAGNEMEPYIFDLITAERDVQPPTIVKTIPEDGEPEAPSDPRFIVEFSERMDQDSFGQDLSLTPDVGIPVEQWICTWSEDGKQVEVFIALEKGLEILQDFTLCVGASSTLDLAGNQMEMDVEIEFTTESPPHEDIDPSSPSALAQAWLYIIWKDASDVWHIIWGGNAAPGALALAGAGTISSQDGYIDKVGVVAWEAGDQQNLIDGVLTFNAAVNGTGGTDGLTFKVEGKLVTFELKNAEPEWIYIGRQRKHPANTTFTLLNED